MSDITLPLPVVLAAIGVTYTGLVAAIAWLAKSNRAKDRLLTRERKRYTHGLKSARFALEQKEGHISVPPRPLEEWDEKSDVVEQEMLKTERWLERKLGGIDASERTPEQIVLPPAYRKKMPSRRG